MAATNATFHHLTWLNNSTVIPSSLQEHHTQWYHTDVCHPGEISTQMTEVSILHGLTKELWPKTFF